MCGSMADIQSAAAEIRRGKKEERKKRNKRQDENIMVCPIHRATITMWSHQLLHVNALTMHEKDASMLGRSKMFQVCNGR